MNPLLTVLIGAAAGATLVKVAQSQKSKTYVKRAQTKLYESTASGLESLEHGSAKLRQKLEVVEKVEDVESVEAEGAPQTEELADEAKD